MGENTWSYFWDSLWTEVSDLTKLSVPIAVNCILNITMSTVDLMFVGHLNNSEQLAACALANVFFTLVTFPLNGFLTALDTLLSQAFGKQDYKVYGDYTQTAAFAVNIAMIGLGTILVFGEPIFLSCGQDPTVAKYAGEFAQRLVWGLWPYCMCMVIMKYVNSQGLSAFVAYINVVANIFNIFFNYILIHYMGLGIVGSPYATDLSRWLQFILNACYLYYLMNYKDKISINCNNNNDDGSNVTKNKETEEKISLLNATDSIDNSSYGTTDETLKRKSSFDIASPTYSVSDTWPQWDLSVCLQHIPLFLSLAIPGAAMLAVPTFSYEISTFLSGLLSVEEMGANSILINFNAVLFMGSLFGLSIAGCIRVGHVAGAGIPAEDIKYTANVMVSYITVVVTIVSLVSIILRTEVGLMFTNNEKIIAIIEKAEPVQAFLLIVNGPALAFQAILLAMGRQSLCLWINVFGFLVVGLPVGVLLTFKYNMSIAGLWMGTTVGMFVMLIMNYWYVSQVDFDAFSRAVSMGNFSSLSDLKAMGVDLEGGKLEDEINKRNSVIFSSPGSGIGVTLPRSRSGTMDSNAASLPSTPVKNIHDKTSRRK